MLERWDKIHAEGGGGKGGGGKGGGGKGGGRRTTNSAEQSTQVDEDDELDDESDEGAETGACELALDREPEIELAALSGEKPVDDGHGEWEAIEVQVDGGSNTCLTPDEGVANACKADGAYVEKSESIKSVTKGAPLVVAGKMTVSAKMQGGSEPLALTMRHAPNGTRTIISESVLWNKLGISTFKEHEFDAPRMCLAQKKTGLRHPLRQSNGLYLTTVYARKMPKLVANTAATKEPAVTRTGRIRLTPEQAAAKEKEQIGKKSELAATQQKTAPEQAAAKEKEQIGKKSGAAATQQGHETKADSCKLGEQCPLCNAPGAKEQAHAQPSKPRAGAATDAAAAAQTQHPMGRLPNLSGANEAVLTWGMRLGVGSDGLKEAEKAVAGMMLPQTYPKHAKRILDDNEIRRRAMSKRPQTSDVAHASTRASEPGHTFCIDGFPLENGYSFIAVDESPCGLVITKQVKNHQVDACEAFCDHIIAFAESKHREVKLFKFDRAPEFRTEELERRLNAKGKAVKVAPRNFHGGPAEAMNDVLTRRAEMMIAGANGNAKTELGDARDYAAAIVNMQPKSGARFPRMQIFARQPIDMRATTPYMYGTTVVIDDTEAGQQLPNKGKGYLGRSLTCKLIGINGTSYIVKKSNGQRLETRKVTPLDESVIIRRGVPAGVATRSGESQTPSGQRPLISPLQASKQAASKTTTAAPAVMRGGLTGARVEVRWPNEHGELRWYAGRIKSKKEQKNGKVRHEVLYDGYPDQAWEHDFGADDLEWRIEGATGSKPPEPKVTQTKGNSYAALQKLGDGEPEEQQPPR